jgi:hypothetical protein
MPQICSVCRHEKHEEIDRALLNQQPYRTIADHWSVSKTALIRHRMDHLAKKLAKATAAAELVKPESPAPAVDVVEAHVVKEKAEADTLLEQLQRIGRDTREILEKAKGSNNHELALKAIARVEKQLELLGRLLGQLDDAAKFAVGIQVNTAAPSHDLDLSKLNPEELQHLRALVIKAQPTPAPVVHQITEGKG